MGQMSFLELILCFAKERNASVNRVQPRRALQRRPQPQPARQPPARRPGNGVLVNTTDILLIRIALKTTYVSAEGRSAMGMETPGPTQNKWTEALSAQMRFLEPILCLAKERNASANRVQPRGALQRRPQQQPPQVQPLLQPVLQPRARHPPAR